MEHGLSTGKPIVGRKKERRNTGKGGGRERIGEATF